MEESYIVKVRIGEEGLKDYLRQFYSERDIEDMDLNNEAANCIDSILQNDLSDYTVLTKNTLIINQ